MLRDTEPAPICIAREPLKSADWSSHVRCAAVNQTCAYRRRGRESVLQKHGARRLDPSRKLLLTFVRDAFPYIWPISRKFIPPRR
jgi:hypothetical protein